ncbi:uncharacterized protein KGF55_002931 [Candida pseudojiufengensis]|uniref:uncharacterized protein n=1 Tax=Candida pseudojiufengensis TaxID=497109 RepID=UPI00222417BF|nr:uncharacterized protein KGF55_002931 [Candida pseudojiufengensis]KAI5963139.1 hypothetical protein KGF55_002931 [Candida pseudojiufengensis]
MIKNYKSIFPKSRQIRKIYIIIPFFLTFLFLLHYLNTYDQVKQWTFQVIDNNNKLKKYFPISNYNEKSLTILPSNFDTTVKIDHNITENNNEIIQFSGNYSPLSEFITNQTYSNHQLTIFESIGESFSEEVPHQKFYEKCNKLQIEKNITITPYQNLKQDFQYIVKTLLKQIENEDAFKEISSFFQGKIPEYLKEDTLNEEHFYKFAGTSVWLEKYGVHLMVSRFLFTQTSRKADPQISLLYSQLYNENWEEIFNIDLILPVVDENGERKYENLNFPRFMPIPFYHNSKKTAKRWYGPEDTRLLLSKNEYGDEEPIVIFNAFHRQVIPISSESSSSKNDKKLPTKFGFYRSMFMGYLFRYQRGKKNVDGGEKKYSKTIYNKVVELKIKDKKREKTEKNWTPFINPSDRNINNLNGGDEFIYIVYQWDHLKILKCELSNPGVVSNCEYHFQEDNTKSKIGPVRGGTELIPIKTKNSSKNKLKQIWIGFLRAHLNKCGCGKAMYRPNFIILIEKNGQFKLSHLSSSISFNIQVDGWKYAHIQCAKKDPNVLIPNGISMYEPNSDYLSLTLSTADKDDKLIHVKGLKKIIEKSLNLKWDGNLHTTQPSKQIECVLDHSIEFCKQYGLKQDLLGVSENYINKLKEEEKKIAKAHNGNVQIDDTKEKDSGKKVEGEPTVQQQSPEQQQQPEQQDEHSNEDKQDEIKQPIQQQNQEVGSGASPPVV